ncbi:hypothetical protein OROHE_003458 [Orobanche hederae]
MSTLLYSVGPNLVLSPFPGRTRTVNPFYRRIHFCNTALSQRLDLRRSLVLARFGLGQVPVPDPEDAELIIRDLFGRVEGFLYTVADAAVNSSDTVDAVSTTKHNNSDWLSGVTNAMEVVLKVLKGGLSTLHTPYAYGFAIILLTVLVKAATFPLTKKQVESTMAMQSLAPQIKAIQERYAGDQDRIQLETARLYKLAGINPLAGCLPTLATIPIWIGLYRALSNVANEGLLTEGFFWIPSLSGPTTIAARQTGSGTSWLFPFIDGHPPLGWSDTLAYLVLPLLLIITQYISVEIMQPPQSNDPNVKSSQAITKLLPFTNNILSTVQQVWLRKLGGAKNPVKQFSDDSVKNEQSTVLKAISETPVAKKVVEKDEKITSEGLRPGERLTSWQFVSGIFTKTTLEWFRQLKEQEAQRKKQRDEERRKADVCEQGSQVKNDEVNKDNSPFEREDSHRATSIGANYVISGGNSSGINGFAVNSNRVSSGVKVNEMVSACEEDNSETSDVHANEGINLHLDKNVEKPF